MFVPCFGFYFITIPTDLQAARNKREWQELNILHTLLKITKICKNLSFLCILNIVHFALPISINILR